FLEVKPEYHIQTLGNQTPFIVYKKLKILWGKCWIAYIIKQIRLIVSWLNKCKIGHINGY
ncbi:hypothetical protein ACXM5X_34505, partial [Pseudomonas saponiphila]